MPWAIKAGGGGLRQKVSSAEFVENVWVRIGVLASGQAVELDVESGHGLVAHGITRIALGNWGGSKGPSLVVLGQSGEPMVTGVRLIDGGTDSSLVELRVGGTASGLLIKSVVVTGESRINGFTFQSPEFIASPGGTALATFAVAATDMLVSQHDSKQPFRVDEDGRAWFGSGTRQMLNMYADDYGAGVQSSTLYQRSGGNFSWHKGGVHSDDARDPGTGGVEQMCLDANGDLTVARRTLNKAARTAPADRELVEAAYVNGRVPVAIPQQVVQLSSVNTGAYNWIEAFRFGSTGNNNYFLFWLYAGYSGASSTHIETWYGLGYRGSNVYGWTLITLAHHRREGLFDKVAFSGAGNVSGTSYLCFRKRNALDYPMTAGMTQLGVGRVAMDTSQSKVSHGPSPPGSPVAQVSLSSRDSDRFGFASENHFDGVTDGGKRKIRGYQRDPCEVLGAIADPAVYNRLMKGDPSVEIGLPRMREDINRYNAERALEALEEGLMRRMIRTPGAIVVPRQHEAMEWLEGIVANPPRDRYVSPADYLAKGIDITDEHQFSL